MEELVSIIITTHGRLPLLKKAYKSAKQQTYHNTEIIIVDDCSEDGTRQWAKQLDDCKYIYIPKEETRGGNYARNLGIRNANGKYIALLDDDDIWANDKIEKQIRLFHDNVGLVYCGHRAIYSDRTVEHIPDEKYKGNLKDIVFTAIFCTTSMLLIDRDVLYKAGLFDENLRFWQEYDLVIRICQITEADFVPEVLVDILQSAPSSDPTRLSHKLKGWEEAVDYINNKYRHEISMLSEDYRKERELMICYDAANRCYLANNRRTLRKYIRKIMLLRPTVRYFAKYVKSYFK